MLLNQPGGDLFTVHRLARHNDSAVTLGGGAFVRRSVERHDYSGADIKQFCGQGQPLGMIAT